MNTKYLEARLQRDHPRDERGVIPSVYIALAMTRRAK